MSVKNVGSKLAQGVRQIKAKQDGTSSAVAANKAPVAAAAKAAAPRAAVKPVAAKPAPVKANESGLQHPDRVWPD